MKSISSPSLFQLPHNRNRRSSSSSSVTGIYGSFTTSSRSTRRSFTIFAKKSKKNQKQPPSSGSNTPPPRITSNLKQNLPIVKYLKESEKKISRPLRPSRYRKKRVDKEETELSDDPPTSLDSMESYKEEDRGGPKVLLVDGYNVCGYWSKLKTEFMGGKLESARQMLIKEMSVFSGSEEMGGTKVVVVFDALRSGLRTHREQYCGVEVVYSGEMCADAWIEKEVKRLMGSGCSDVTIATSDRAMTLDAYFKGASVWNCETLVSEIEEAHKEIDRDNERSSIVFKHRSLLKNNLGLGAVARLREMRRRLLLKEMERRTQAARAKAAASKINRKPRLKVPFRRSRRTFDVGVPRPPMEPPLEPPTEPVFIRVEEGP